MPRLKVNYFLLLLLNILNIVPTQPFLRARFLGEQGVLSALYINESIAPRIVSGTHVCVCVCVCVCLYVCACTSGQTLGEPMDCKLTGPLSMEFSRQEYWRGSPFPLPGDPPNPGMERAVSCLSRIG